MTVKTNDALRIIRDALAALAADRVGPTATLRSAVDALDEALGDKVNEDDSKAKSSK